MRSLLFVVILMMVLYAFSVSAKGEDIPISWDEIPTNQAVDETTKSTVLARLFQTPLHFVANEGQFPEEVVYYAKSESATVYCTDQGLTFRFAEGHISLKISEDRRVKPEARGELEGKVNYFIGNDPALWRTDIPTFKEVVYHEVYSGIDLVYSGNQRRLKYTFYLQPHSEPNQILMTYDGIESLCVDDATGELVIQTPWGEMRDAAPVAYQEIEGVKKAVDISFRLIGENRVGFALGDYDPNFMLVLDPGYSTYIGGSNRDNGAGIAVDSEGNAYITGSTTSSNFPTENAYQGSNAGWDDPFVTKLSSSGNMLIYSTYLGGSNQDHGCSIAVDSEGNAYITGATCSSDFPTTENAYQGSHGGPPKWDAFVTKLSSSGNTLIYSTYLGGSSHDLGVGIAVDSAKNAYVTGHTSSSNFPTTENAYQGSYAGGWDAFVTKLNSSGDTLIYSTYLGGSSYDIGRGIALDSSENAYITGETSSSDFPTLNTYQGSYGGGDLDVFVTKFSSSGNTLIYSTYLGGSGEDKVYYGGIVVDSEGNAYITGATSSPNFPTTENAYQGSYGGGDYDAFVTKLKSSGDTLIYSTYLGGSSSENTNYQGNIAVDSSGNAYVTGATNSSDFPTVNAYQDSNAGHYDAFVTWFNSDGNSLRCSTYLGGGNDDYGLGIAVDSSGNAYVTGYTYSSDFPTLNPYQSSLGGDYDTFVASFLSDDSFPKTIYVSTDTIQAAIDAAENGDTVLVADGTWNGSNLDFKGKAITVKSENGPDNCIIYCGQGSRGFIFINGEGKDSVVSGFTIIDAWVKVQNNQALSGGGIYCEFSSPTITNCIITGNKAENHGGGIYCYSSNPTITDCIITGNTTRLGGGGGVCCYSFSSATITNCIISGNTAELHGGGVYCDSHSSATITNCIISNNTAGRTDGFGYGGGVYFVLKSPTITNCIITGNTAYSGGGGIYCSYSNLTIINCILWDDSPEEIYVGGGSNPVVTYSDIQGGYAGEGNIATDPMFVDATNGDYHLSDYSPCIGAGTSNGAPTTDIEGNARGTPPDIGAYENSRNEPLPPSITLTSPNGGEVWGGGSSHDITWETLGPGIDHIRLLYSTNSGSTYPNTIIASTGDDGVYEWNPVPSLDFATVRVKGIAEDSSNTALAEDASDGDFTIDSTHPTPNTIASIVAVSANQIDITSTEATDDSPPVFYRLEGQYYDGAAWVDSGGGVSDCDYSATRPNPWSDKNLVENGWYRYWQQVKDSAEPENESAWSAWVEKATWLNPPEDSEITLANVTTTGMDVTVATPPKPSGAGSTGAYFDLITGEGQGSGATDRGYADDYTAEYTDLTPNTQYGWKVKYRNRDGVETAYNENEQQKYTLANTPSAPTVSNPTSTTLDVEINPNGNPTHTPFAIYNVTGSYYVNSTGGSNGATEVWQTKSAWGTVTVVDLTPGTTYHFQCKAKNGDGVETSLGASGSKTTPSITLTSPNGGEILRGGDSHDITWNTSGPGIDHIRLLYSTDSGNTYPNTIVASTENNGTYTWTVPTLDSSTVRVKAIAEDANNNSLADDESDADFTIDSTAPETTATLSGTEGENGWYISDVTVELSATDNLSDVKETNHKINDGAWETYSSPFTISGTTIYYKSEDNAGNVEADKSKEIKVDKTAPETPVVTDDGDCTTNGSQLHASWISSDDKSGISEYQYAIGTTAGETDIISWTSVGTDTFVTATGLSLTDGQMYYFSVKAKSGAGLWSSVGVSDGIIVNLTPPVEVKVLDLTAPPGETIIVPISVSDVTGLDFIAVELTLTYNPNILTARKVIIEGTLTEGWTSSVNITNGQIVIWMANTTAPSGSGALVSIEFQVSPNAQNGQTSHLDLSKVRFNEGRITATTVDGVFTVDNIPPETTISLSGTQGDNDWYISDVTVTLPATDTGSGVKETKYKIGSGSWKLYPPAFTISDEGTTTVYYYSEDNAGNIESEKSLEIKIDRTAPDVPTLIAYTPDPTDNTTPTLDWNDATGASTYHIQIDDNSDFSSPIIDDSTLTASSYTPENPLPEGVIYWRVKSKDDAGNESEYSDADSFTIDVTPPAPNTIASIVAVSASQIDLTSTEATDDTPPVSYHLDGQYYDGAAWVDDGGGVNDYDYSQTRPNPWSDTNLVEDGRYRYRQQVKDSATPENESVWSDWVEKYTLANTPSAPTVSNPTSTTLDVTINPNGNPNDTEFAIYNVTGKYYINASGGSNGDTEVWQTKSDWGTVTVVVLTQGTTYAFKCKAKNGDGVGTDLGAPGSGTTLTAPTVTNSTGESNVTATSARLNGEVTSTGGESPTVHIYWGDNDAGTTAGTWDNDVDIGTKGAETFYTDISSLSPNTTYYYRCYAENSAGGSWASSTETFTTVAPPSVSSATPNALGQGASNKNVVIAGTNFQSGASVTFSNTGITVNSTQVDSSTQITVNVSVASDAPTGSRSITVTNPDSQSGTKTGIFTVNPAPTITTLSPSELPQGTTNEDVTITGNNFQDSASVSFSGTGITVNSTTFVSATEIKANISIEATAPLGKRDVTVINPDYGVGSKTDAFTVITPLVVDAGEAKSICHPNNGGSTQIGGNPTASGGTPPYTYNWSPAGSLDDASIANPTATPTETTIYTVTVTDSSNPQQQGSDTVTVTVYPELIADAGEAPEPINSGDTVRIGGNPTASGGTSPYQYSWSPTSGLDDATIANPTASPSKTTTYIVTVTDNKGCVDTDDVTVTISNGNSNDNAILAIDFVYEDDMGANSIEATKCVPMESTFYAYVVAQEVVNLATYNVVITFDSSILKYENAYSKLAPTLFNIFEKDGGEELALQIDATQAATGKVILTNSLRGTEHAPSGNGLLAIVEFTRKAQGTTTITFGSGAKDNYLISAAGIWDTSYITGNQLHSGTVRGIVADIASAQGECIQDGYVDGFDLYTMGRHWHHTNASCPSLCPSGHCPADIASAQGECIPDGNVEGRDLYTMGAHWHEGTPLEASTVTATTAGVTSNDGRILAVDFVYEDNSGADTIENTTNIAVGQSFYAYIVAQDVVNLATYNVVINFDASILTYVEADSGAGLSLNNILEDEGGKMLGLMIDEKHKANGRLELTNTLKGNENHPSGNGLLGVIKFTVQSRGETQISFGTGATDNYLISVKGIADTSFISNGQLLNGVVNQTIWGDVSGDGYVSAYDATLILQKNIGLRQFTPQQEAVADVSGAGGITAYDAALILQYVVGRINQFPVQSGADVRGLNHRTTADANARLHHVHIGNASRCVYHNRSSFAKAGEEEE